MKKIKGVLKIAVSLMTVIVMVMSLFLVSVQAEEVQGSENVRDNDFEEQFDKVIKGQDKVSVAAAVFFEDEVYTKYSGYADIENEVLADKDTVYEWGSVSKTLVWVSAMQLYEQGKLDLDADIRKYLPDGFLKKLKYDTPITMTDLMNHKGGWQQTTYTIQVQEEENIVPLGESLQYSEPPQVFKPGVVSSHSNWGAALAGYVVECISKMSYGDYVRKNILEPIGMEHTSVTPDHKDNMWVRSQREKLKSYYVDPQGVAESLGTNMAFITLYPAGAVTGTVDDMRKYAQALVADNSPLFQKKETFDKLFSASDFYDDGATPSICHGFFFMNRAFDTIEHSGSTDACSSNLAVDRETKTGVVVLTNQAGGNGICTEITEMVFGKSANNPVFDKKDITKTEDISGQYYMSRGFFSGQQKIMSVLSMIPVEKVSDSKYKVGASATIKQIGDRLYALEQNGENVLLGFGVDDTGRKIIRGGGADYVETKSFYIEVFLIIAYVLTAVISVIIIAVKLVILIVRLIRKTKKSFAGKTLITVSQIIKPLSVAAVVSMMIILNDSMGLSRIQGFAFGIIQLVFMAIYILTAVFCSILIFSKRENKSSNIRYIFSIISNSLAAAFIFTFELWCFWI